MFSKAISLFLGLLFFVSTAEACLLTQEEFNDLEITTDEVLRTHPYYFAFRGVVYNFKKMREGVLASHAMRFERKKKRKDSEISEYEYQTHNSALHGFLTRQENAVGRLKGALCHDKDTSLESTEGNERQDQDTSPDNTENKTETGTERAEHPDQENSLNGTETARRPDQETNEHQNPENFLDGTKKHKCEESFFEYILRTFE